jgi:sec-independent protein translocase protein TatA
MLLFLNDIAGSEVLLILFFVLMFFGSKSIPGIAKTFGQTIRQIKDASSDLQKEIKKSTSEMTGDININSILKEKTEDFQQPFDQVLTDVEHAVNYDPKRLDVIDVTAVQDSLDDETSPTQNLEIDSKEAKI